jgi:hypothetical protein
MKTTMISVCLIFGLFANLARGQEVIPNRKKTTSISLEGMLGVSFGKEFYFINVGGPALFLNLTPHLKIGIGAFPSLYSLNNKLGARLGVSPRIDYKNFVLIAPFFHREISNTWIRSVGFGYKFHKKQPLKFKNLVSLNQGFF